MIKSKSFGALVWSCNTSFWLQKTQTSSDLYSPLALEFCKTAKVLVFLTVLWVRWKDFPSNRVCFSLWLPLWQETSWYCFILISASMTHRCEREVNPHKSNVQWSNVTCQLIRKYTIALESLIWPGLVFLKCQKVSCVCVCASLVCNMN